MDKFIVDSYQFASDVVEGVHIVDGEWLILYLLWLLEISSRLFLIFSIFLESKCPLITWDHQPVKYRARLVQLHEQLHEQLHNFNSQTTNSLVNFSENSLSSQS
jgi:hypothetical protein